MGRRKGRKRLGEEAEAQLVMSFQRMIAQAGIQSDDTVESLCKENQQLRIYSEITMLRGRPCLKFNCHRTKYRNRSALLCQESKNGTRIECAK